MGKYIVGLAVGNKNWMSQQLSNRHLTKFDLAVIIRNISYMGLFC